MKKRQIKICAFLLFAAIAAAVISCAPGDDVMPRYAKAKELYALRRFSEASEILSGINTFVPALILHAKAQYFSGNLEKAESLCLKAIKRRPSAFEAKLYLARISGEKGDDAQAEKIVLGLLADNPQDIRTLRFASELALRQGKNHEAQVLLDQALELSAENAVVFLDSARLHWIAGRQNEALEDLGKAGILLPSDTSAARSVERLKSRIKESLQ